MKRLLPILTLIVTLTAASLPGSTLSKDLSGKNNPAKKPVVAPVMSMKHPAYNELNRFNLIPGSDRLLTLNPFYGYKGTMEVGFTQSELGKNFITIHTMLTFHQGNTTLLIPRTFVLATSPEINFLPRKADRCYMYWNN